jgi:DNA invertase Pin-like site-specific DNA recombinase
MSAKIAEVDQATIQHLLERYGKDALSQSMIKLSIRENKKVYGFGYVRISDPRSDPESLGLQEEILRKFAEENDVTILRIYSDFGKSGGLSVEKRKDFVKLIMDLQPGFRIVASRADRLFRNRDEKKVVKEWISAKNAVMMAPDYKPDEEFNKAASLPNEVLDLVNEHYRHVTAEKVKNTLRQKSADGTLRTKPHYGWKFDGKGKPWLEVEYEQKALKKIKALKISNPKITNGTIIEELVKAGFRYAKEERVNSSGVLKPPTTWTYACIRNILLRMGLVQIKGAETLPIPIVQSQEIGPIQTVNPQTPLPLGMIATPVRGYGPPSPPRMGNLQSPETPQVLTFHADNESTEK